MMYYILEKIVHLSRIPVCLGGRQLLHSVYSAHLLFCSALTGPAPGHSSVVFAYTCDVIQHYVTVIMLVCTYF